MSAEKLTAVTVLHGDGVPHSVCLCGELDVYTANKAMQAIRDLLDQKPDAVDIDLWGVCYIDSAGLGVLFGVNRQAGEQGTSLRLLYPRPAVLRQLDITRLSAIAEVVQAPSQKPCPDCESHPGGCRECREEATRDAAEEQPADAATHARRAYLSQGNPYV